jgi:hypothetical protein
VSGSALSPSEIEAIERAAKNGQDDLVAQLLENI